MWVWQQITCDTEVGLKVQGDGKVGLVRMGLGLVSG